MPIGGVLATKRVIVPNAVGVDIGCGMQAVKTNLKSCHMNILKLIMGKIREKVPVGFDHHKEPQNEDLMPVLHTQNQYKIVKEQFKPALKQLGTLGGGNHFIEIQQDQDGYIWFMVHSGSRNIGKRVCDYYNNKAKELNSLWNTSIPKEWDLAFLPIEIYEAKEYFAEMNFCLEFALANRNLIIQRIKEAFKEIVKDTQFTFSHDIHHNYASWENHFGENVIVHRKGAVLVRENQIGIIPGSQGTKSYIVKGLGNPSSFNSCSHGAGRKMGRNEARKTLNLAEEKKKLEDLGILHSIRHTQDLDEASGAYKDIKDVMENQKDLVEIITELTPLGVIKG
jgi:tRNA-splicing ligase RtcB